MIVASVPKYWNTNLFFELTGTVTIIS